MKAKWIIVNFGKQDQLTQLFYGIQEAGREAEVVSFKDFVEMTETFSDERACIVTTGSIWVNTHTRKMRPNWAGNWHDESLFTCKRYYSFWGKYLTQQDYMMLPLGEIERRKDWLYQKVGVEDEMFIRPDSGAKEFTGELVSKGRFDAWLNEVKGVNTADLLCVVAPPRRLDRELRLVIKDGKVVTGASYRIAKHLAQEPLHEMNGMDKVVDFAEKVLADNPPPLPPVHCLDIAISGDNISVLEVGCFCCAGLYCCDRGRIAVAVSEAAEEEFERNTAKPAV